MSLVFITVRSIRFSFPELQTRKINAGVNVSGAWNVWSEAGHCGAVGKADPHAGRSALRDYRYTSLKAEQMRAVESVLKRKDTFVSVPTGKSFQVHPAA